MKKKIRYKLMWLGKDEPFLWDIYNEEPAPDQNSKLIRDCIDFSPWLNKYSRDYFDWMNLDIKSIYDLKDSNYLDMINSIKEFNASTIYDISLFYWYDIDRTLDSGFVWTNCILCNRSLTEIKNTHYLNRKVCLSDYLVFPGIPDKI